MSIYRKSLLQIMPLILLLLAGQLQAKTICICSMMDKNIHSEIINIDKNIQDKETCCHSHGSSDYANTTSLDTDSCPNKILGLSIDQNIQINTSISDLLFESEIDPFQIKPTTLSFIFSSQITVPTIKFSSLSHPLAGSRTYFITQRLRF